MVERRVKVALMKRLHVELPDELAEELEHAIRDGRFQDRADAIRVALRMASANKDKGTDTISSSRDPRVAAYERRAFLLKNAWEKTSTESALRALNLRGLITAMKQSSGSDTPSTSMYFAGADVDHPFFLKSDVLAIGIAVLPEDAEKAKAPKRHPHQVEVIFVLDGGLDLHLEGRLPITLRTNDHYVIEKNVCHWVTPLAHEPGAFLFVKTNPAQEPRGISCGPL